MADLVNIAGGSTSKASSTWNAGPCAENKCAPHKVTDAVADADDDSRWVSMPQKSCPAGYTEWLEVDWSQRQHSSNGSLPISRIGIEYYDGSLSGFKPPTANLFLYEKASDVNAIPISVTPMLIKGDDQKVYYYSMVPPRRAAKLRFQFTDLVSDSKNECYVAVQEVKVFTSLSSESAPTGDMNPLSISLIVILCILLAIGIPAGAFLYLRQRQLAKRLGFKIIGTDGEMDSR